MTEESNDQKKDFLYPIPKYRGEFTPSKLVFNANLQEFGQKVSFLCALESNGKIKSEEAYEQIKKMWHQLKHSKKQLLDNSNLANEEHPDK